MLFFTQNKRLFYARRQTPVRSVWRLRREKGGKNKKLQERFAPGARFALRLEVPDEIGRDGERLRFGAQFLHRLIRSFARRKVGDGRH